jgi:hypothetical protein
MGFKENLLKKIEIGQLVNRAGRSLAATDSGTKLDKEAVRRLLEIAGYHHRRVREMDFYLKDPDRDPDSDPGIMLVLDNDLTIYDTTIEDAAMRKNPVVKEMVSIRGIIKILNDKDVVVSRKLESLARLQQECLATLDLSYSESDIAGIARSGFASLESNYPEGVIESLDLFAELLEYRPPPKPFVVSHQKIIGALEQKASGEMVYGPVAAFSRIDNRIRLVKEPVGSYDRPAVQRYQKVLAGEEQAFAEGEAVFQFLKNAVLQQNV